MYNPYAGVLNVATYKWKVFNYVTVTGCQKDNCNLFDFELISEARDAHGIWYLCFHLNMILLF